MLSAIVAVSNNDVIGNKGQIPWRLPADLKFAKQKTMGHTLIMGRKTHKSIGKALPGRTNVVISRNPKYKPADGAIVVSSLSKALDLDEVKNDAESFIFGGEAIYKLAMPYLNKIYLTRVNTTVNGDAFFKYDNLKWREISRSEHKADNENQYNYAFITLEPK